MNLFVKIKNFVQRYLPKDSFMRSVGVLAGGTALAQGIGIVALPFITRLYTPEDFSILAVYSSIVAIASVSICLRLEIAITLPEREEDAANLFTLAIGACALFSALSGLLLWVFSDEFVDLINQPALRPYVLMLPLGIWLSGTYSAIQFWSTRKKRFQAIAQTRMSQSIGNVLTQIGFGLFTALGAAGLLVGQLISFGAGLLRLGRLAWHSDETARRAIQRSTMKLVLNAYGRYPKYSTFEALANIGAIQLPIVIIGAAAVGPEAGYLFLAMKAAAIPLGLIGGSISQVYLSQAPLEKREGRLDVFTLDILDKLIKIGVGPLIFIGIASPTLIPLVFGNDWERAGVMIAWMTPWFLAQFLVSPISMALHVTGYQGLAMINQFFAFSVRVGLTGLAALFAVDKIFESYALSGFVTYSVYFLLLAYVTKIKPVEFKKKIRMQVFYCIPWFSAGLLVVFGKKFIT